MSKYLDDLSKSLPQLEVGTADEHHDRLPESAEDEQAERIRAQIDEEVLNELTKSLTDWVTETRND